MSSAKEKSTLNWPKKIRELRKLGPQILTESRLLSTAFMTWIGDWRNKGNSEMAKNYKKLSVRKEPLSW